MLKKIQKIFINNRAVKHFTYKELCYYLVEKHGKGSSNSDFKSHLDGCNVCWEIWNRVRWDAAWTKTGLMELKDYLSKKFEPYLDSSWALAVDWYAQNPKTRGEINSFYESTPYYLYNSLIFKESGDRLSFAKDIKKLKKKYAVTSAIDYGCGIGNDLLDLSKEGIVTYGMDFDSPSLDFLKWRLSKRSFAKKEINRLIIPINEEMKIPEVDMIWSVDVIEHMSNPKDFIDLITPSIKIIALFTDADDEAGGRHPFHFPQNIPWVFQELKKMGYVQVRENSMDIWINKQRSKK